jgi:hypothetical protein
MERYIKYKRFAETHPESTVQDFYDRLVTEGWEIIYYNEIRCASGVLSSSPQEANIHIVVLAGKRQDDGLKGKRVLD